MINSTITASQIFNGFIGANLCYNLNKFGIFDFFNDNNKVCFKQLSVQIKRKNTYNTILLLIQTGIKFGIFTRDSNNYLALTLLGKDLKKNIGFFIWSVGGYGKLLRDLPYDFICSRKDNRIKLEPLIDGKSVALGSHLANRSFMEEDIKSQISKYPSEKIIDIGCGNSEFLIKVCHKNSHLKGVGIDINTDAISESKKNIRKGKLENRVSSHIQNVLKEANSSILQQHFLQADTIVSLMMMHDLFNTGNPIHILRNLKIKFPNMKRLFVADTFTSNEKRLTENSPIFTFGFEFVHNLMNIKLFKKSEYELYFNKAGFTIINIIHLNLPNTYLSTPSP